jgi:serine protease Do
VIGINVAYIPPEARAESIGFAIPGPRVRDAVDELLSRGRVTEAFLGLVLTPLSPQIAERFGIREDGGATSSRSSRARRPPDRDSGRAT